MKTIYVIGLVVVAVAAGFAAAMIIEKRKKTLTVSANNIVTDKAA